MDGALRVGLVVALLVASCVGPAAATTDSDADGSAVTADTALAGDDTPVVADACFTGKGHPLEIGNDGQIRVVIHTSLFTNLTRPGSFGIEAEGSALDEPIVALKAGVRFAGVGDPADFVLFPFRRFAIVFDYTFRLPMFDGVGPGDFTYESDESPVSGVNSTDC